MATKPHHRHTPSWESRENQNRRQWFLDNRVLPTFGQEYGRCTLCNREHDKRSTDPSDPGCGHLYCRGCLEKLVHRGAHHCIVGECKRPWWRPEEQEVHAPEPEQPTRKPSKKAARPNLPIIRTMSLRQFREARPALSPGPLTGPPALSRSGAIRRPSRLHTPELRPTPREPPSDAGLQRLRRASTRDVKRFSWQMDGG